MDQIQVLDSSVMMAEGIFHEGFQAIVTSHLDLFVHDQLDQKGFEHILECFRTRLRHVTSGRLILSPVFSYFLTN